MRARLIIPEPVPSLRQIRADAHQPRSRSRRPERAQVIPSGEWTFHSQVKVNSASSGDHPRTPWVSQESTVACLFLVAQNEIAFPTVLSLSSDHEVKPRIPKP